MLASHIEIDSEIARSDTKRDKQRLTVIKQIRLDNPELLIINTPWKRFLLCVRYEMRMHPDTEFSKAMRNLLYDDRHFAEKMGAASPYTILRDNGELERLGFFQKPEKVPYDPEEG